MKKRYYRVKGGVSLLFPGRIPQEDRVWAKPGTIIVVDDPVLQAWATAEKWKLAEIGAPEAEENIKGGRGHWRGVESLTGAARELYREQSRAPKPPSRIQMAAGDEEGIGVPPLKPPPMGDDEPDGDEGRPGMFGGEDPDAEDDEPTKPAPHKGSGGQGHGHKKGGRF